MWTHGTGQQCKEMMGITADYSLALKGRMRTLLDMKNVLGWHCYISVFTGRVQTLLGPVSS